MTEKSVLVYAYRAPETPQEAILRAIGVVKWLGPA